LYDHIEISSYQKSQPKYNFLLTMEGYSPFLLVESIESSSKYQFGMDRFTIDATNFLENS
jgi:hypothetical protein